MRKVIHTLLLTIVSMLLAGLGYGQGSNGGVDTVTGVVTQDGHKFTTEGRVEWMVDNPEKLKGLEGQTITLKAWTKSGGTKRNGKDTQENKMHVLEVKPARSMGRNADKK